MRCLRRHGSTREPASLLLRNGAKAPSARAAPPRGRRSWPGSASPRAGARGRVWRQRPGPSSGQKACHVTDPPPHPPASMAGCCVPPSTIRELRPHVRLRPRDSSVAARMPPNGTISPGSQALEASDAIPMWVADMDLLRPPGSPPRCWLTRRGVHGYICDTGSWATALTDWMQRRHDLRLNPGWVTATPGIVAGLGLFLQALSAPGDEVVVSRPSIMRSAGSSLPVSDASSTHRRRTGRPSWHGTGGATPPD